MHKVVLLSLLLTLALSACVGVESQPVVGRGVAEPAILAPGQPQSGPATGGEKEVQLATQTLTPSPAAALPAETSAPGAPVAVSTPTPIGTPTAAPWPTAILLSGVQMVPYADTVTGFSFQYPGFWNITDLPNDLKQNSMAYTISLRSPAPQAGPKQMDGIAPGVAAVDITVVRDGAKTLAQAADERRQAARTAEPGPLKILLDEATTLPGGLPAQHFIYQDASGTTTQQVVLMVNEVNVVISGFGEQTLFATVVGSIREEKK